MWPQPGLAADAPRRPLRQHIPCWPWLLLLRRPLLLLGLRRIHIHRGASTHILSALLLLLLPFRRRMPPPRFLLILPRRLPYQRQRLCR